MVYIYIVLLTSDEHVLYTNWSSSHCPLYTARCSLFRVSVDGLHCSGLGLIMAQCGYWKQCLLSVRMANWYVTNDISSLTTGHVCILCTYLFTATEAFDIGTHTNVRIEWEKAILTASLTAVFVQSILV